MRLSHLDGLRGLASLIVLFHHGVLVIPAFAEPYFGISTSNPLASLLIFSPLHIFWAGTEAVYLFFVLSGIVLYLMTRSEKFNWTTYFPSRLFRIYAPVALAVLLGIVIITATRTFEYPDSLWMKYHAGGYTPTAFLSDLTLIGGTSGRISQLWSLQWEVIFSLLLPVFILIPKIPKLISVAGLLALIFIGSFWGNPALMFLPMFGIGIQFASSWFHTPQVNTADRNVSPIFGFAMIIVSIILISARWWSPAIFFNALPLGLATVTCVLGILLLIWVTTYWEASRKVFSSRIMVSLGTISFSLYLVHEPIVVGVAKITGGSIWGIVISVVLSLIVAILFYVLVEKKLHKRARKIAQNLNM